MQLRDTSCATSTPPLPVPVSFQAYLFQRDSRSLERWNRLLAESSAILLEAAHAFREWEPEAVAALTATPYPPTLAPPAPAD